MINTTSVTATTKDKLMKLTQIQIDEKYKSRINYYIFKGACEDEDAAQIDESLLGQSWVPNLTVDYVPTVDIRNKVKPLLNRQKRFMFGKPPTIKFKPRNEADKKTAEELQHFIEDILEDNDFWSDSMKAFLSASIKKRVLLRVEANPNQPVQIFYEPVDNFHFKVNSNNYKQVKEIILTAQDQSTVGLELTKQIWYRYIYYMDANTKTCHLKTDVFNGGETIGTENEEYKSTDMDTKLSSLPAWVIFNGGYLGDIEGTSDVEDLKGPQEQYNRKVSDFGDALKFQMFGETYIIDGTEKSVNEITIAPNALAPIVSIPDKTASVQKVQSPFTSADPVNKYLDGIHRDMYETMSMPTEEALAAVPSGKALKYLYTDLIASCDEKWHDWEGPIKKMMKFIIEACAKLNCYPTTWDKKWNNLKFKIELEHNYPIPEDEDAKKDTGLKEVAANVRSKKSYMKDFKVSEDVDGEWIEILDENVQMTSATTDQFEAKTNEELNGTGSGEGITGTGTAGTGGTGDLTGGGEGTGKEGLTQDDLNNFRNGEGVVV